MDFKRIEWIFLVVFIGLNIFLGFSFFQGQQVDRSTTKSGDAATVSDIARDQIKLPTLSQDMPKGDYLASQGKGDLNAAIATLQSQQATITTGDDETLNSRLNTPLELPDKEATATAKNFVKQNIYHGTDYQYVEALSTKNTYYFAQKTSAGVIYDRRAAVVLTVSGGHLISYTQTYLSDLDVLRDKLTLMNEQDAVITLYRENEIPNNSAVVSVALAYTYLLDAKGSTVYVPAWHVGIENRATKNVVLKKVNAITRTVMKSHD